MKWLVEAALRLRALVLGLAVALLVVGVRVAQTTPLDVFPEFSPPRVEIQVEAPGLSAEEMENLVTTPLESALNGTAWLKTMRSKSTLGLTLIVMQFEDDVDILRARQLVQERIATEAGRLPAAAHPPVVMPPASSLARVLQIGLRSQRLSPVELSELARWVVRPRLMAVPGVSSVSIWGRRDKQLQVLVDPDRLRARGVSLEAVQRAAGDAAAVSAGGFIDSPNQRITVRQLGALTLGSAEHEADAKEVLARAVVHWQDGAPIRLGDVAEVEVSHGPSYGTGVVDGETGVLIVVSKTPWANTLEVTRGLDEAMRQLEPGLAGVTVDSSIFRPAKFIQRSLSNLSEAMLLGSLLVALVLGLFLYNLRTALISVTAIPLSLLAATLVLRAIGGTLNTMVLAGLVIAVGEVVDDAIIDVENIERRLRENAARAEPRSVFRVVLDASLEVRSAVVYASLIIGLVFLPIFFLEGLAGSFFRPLAVSYVLAIIASLLVALTLTPVLSLYLLPRGLDRLKSPPFLPWLKRSYRALLDRVLARPRVALLAVASAVLVPLLAFPLLGEELLPTFKENDFLMHFIERPGTGLDATTRGVTQASKALLEVPGVTAFGAHVGRAEAGDEPVGPNFAEMWIHVDEGASYDATIARVEATLEQFPGVSTNILTYLRERTAEVLSGSGASVVVRIHGPDLDVLREEATRVAELVKRLDGIADLEMEPQTRIPQINVRIRAEAAARFGISPGDVRRATGAMIQGEKVGEIFEAGRVAGVVVWGVPRVRQDVDSLSHILVESRSGARVPLADVADVELVSAPGDIRHNETSRRFEILINVKRGAQLGKVATNIEETVRRAGLPRGYYVELLGEYEERKAAKRRLLALGTASLAGILLLLYLDFKTPRLVALVALSLPFALLGGVAGAVLGGGSLSLGSLVGFVTVLGIAARNGILLVSHYRHLEREEGVPFGLELVRRGAEERLAPILMTALCAGLALVPLVLRGNVPGHEIEHPMACVILGGLVTSTLLNLFLMPSLYARFAPRRNGVAPNADEA